MRKVRPVLEEILDAIGGIETHTAGKSLADLLSLAPGVPWKQIRGMGNILRHEYHKIADDVVWAVVTENIGPLKAAILVLKLSLRDA